MFTVDFMKHKIGIIKKNSVAFIFCIQAVELMGKRLTNSKFFFISLDKRKCSVIHPSLLLKEKFLVHHS